MREKDSEIKKTVASGLFWKLSERFGAQIVTLIVSIILARLLSPEEYGTIALITVFITIANVFVSDGFGNALIQKKNADQLDFSSVFHFNLFLGIVLYGIMFVLAKPIALFYNRPQLVAVIRVFALRLPLASINSVQHAFVAKKMIFKKFFFSTLSGTILSAVVGIWMAYAGYGVWALVAQYLTNTAVSTLVLTFTLHWFPSMSISFLRLKSLVAFGWKLMVAGLTTTFFVELRSLIIGKKYSADDLAYYNRGQQIPSLLITNVNTSIDSVLFAAMSQRQDDIVTVKAMIKKALKTSSFLIFPAVFGLAMVAHPLMVLLLTEKWADCVIYMQIACFTYGFTPIYSANLQAMKATGHADVYLKLDVVKKIISFVALLIAMWFGPLGIAISGIVTTVISCILNMIPSKKLTGYSWQEQVRDVLPALLMSIAMSATVWGIGKLLSNLFLKLIVQLFIGVFVYVLLAIVSKNESFQYLWSTAKGMLKKKKQKGNAK